MNDDEKICPRCAETVKKAALVCRYCGHEFETPPKTQPPRQFVKPPPPDDSKSKQARNGLLGCLGLIVVLGLIGQCTGGGGGESNSVVFNTTNEALPINAFDHLSPSANKSTPVSDWTVSTQRDALRGKLIHYAIVTSINSVSFDFPYGGGSTLTMTVRRHPKWGDDVIFEISKGQFVCGIYNCRGTINFGKGAEALTLNEPEDHSSDTLFAANGSSVIAKLKKSDRVIVELPFFQEGNRQFTFNTKGLVWPPKT